MSLADLEKEIADIKQRNKRVEKDKVWEKSWTRRFFLMLFTYIAIGLYLQAIRIERAWINAIVPTLGFFLSTLTLPYFKRLWEKHIYKA